MVKDLALRKKQGSDPPLRIVGYRNCSRRIIFLFTQFHRDQELLPQSRVNGLELREEFDTPSGDYGICKKAQ